MCGIAGFCNHNMKYSQNEMFWRNVLVSMRESVCHRGRDDSGEYLKEHAGLGHARLSIRDLTGGKQPMIRNVDGKEYVIVYNGEIYNTDEIVPDLLKAGLAFLTTCDTEVVLYAYIHYGVDFVKRLNGIYAFAIWDEYEQRLILYRDRLGVKPLFYGFFEDTLVFGSEIKVLFKYPGFNPEVDMNGFREVFGLGPARTQGNGVFKGVYEIKPGHYAIFSKDGFNSVRYWALESKEHKDSYEETVEKVSWLVRDAVRRQLVSDVPVCSFLSGGVDSSIVTAIACDYINLNTFSFDFKGNEKYFQSSSYQPERDRPYVEEMINRYNVNHTWLECDENILVDWLEKVVDAKDLPGMADIDASLMYFCSLVKEYNKVCLTGECADEVFGGYPWFYREDLINVNGFPWSFDFSSRISMLDDSFANELKLEEYAYDKYLDSLKLVPYMDGENDFSRRHREITWLNIAWFMQTLLDRMDRASMYFGLEARVPFADHRIVEYVFNVPGEYKFKNGIEKSLLRDAFYEGLPERLLKRKKSPYPKTYNPNYLQLLKNRFVHMINDSSSPILGIIDKKKALSVLENSNYTKPWFGQLMAFPQLVAYMLQVDYWMRKYKISC